MKAVPIKNYLRPRSSTYSSSHSDISLKVSDSPKMPSVIPNSTSGCLKVTSPTLSPPGLSNLGEDDKSFNSKETNEDEEDYSSSQSSFPSAKSSTKTVSSETKKCSETKKSSETNKSSETKKSSETNKSSETKKSSETNKSSETKKSTDKVEAPSPKADGTPTIVKAQTGKISFEVKPVVLS